MSKELSTVEFARRYTGGEFDLGKLGNWTAEKIKALRARLELSQEDFARRLGLSSGTTVSGWELGRRRPGRMMRRELDRLEAEHETRPL